MRCPFRVTIIVWIQRLAAASSGQHGGLSCFEVIEGAPDALRPTPMDCARWMLLLPLWQELARRIRTEWKAEVRRFSSRLVPAGAGLPLPRVRCSSQHAAQCYFMVI